MRPGTLQIGRLAGIPIAIHPLWFAIVALFTVALGADYYPSAVPGIEPSAAYALGLATVLALFASVVAHELGHALVARRDGVEIEEIELWPLGGVARMRTMPGTPVAELRMALAGPAVSVGLALTLIGIALAVPRDGALALREALAYLGLLNGVLAIFNMVPALPLDGGRVAHAIIWWRGGDRDRATLYSSVAGRAFGWFFVTIGVASWLSGTAPGPWLAVIGIFVLVAASAEQRSAIVHQAFGGVSADQLMSKNPAVISEVATVMEAVNRLARERHTAMPVVDRDRRAVGVVSVADLARVAVDQRDRMVVSAVMQSNPELFVAPKADVAELLEAPAFVEVGRAVVTDGCGRPDGILSITDVERALRGLSLIGPGARLS